MKPLPAVPSARRTVAWPRPPPLSGRRKRPSAPGAQLGRLEQANEKALGAGIDLHMKQYDHPRNNPVVQCLMQRGLGWTHAFRLTVAEGLELASHEKGSATYKGRVIQEKPTHFHRLKAELNRGIRS